MQFARRTFCVTGLLFACSGNCASLRADVIELATGGRVEGQIVPSDDGDKNTFIIDLAGGGRLVVPRSQVARIDTTTDVDAEYQQLARSSPDTVDGHEKLAEWCRQHKLEKEHERHMQRIVEIDPNHAAARAALGFRQKDGKWMDRDDVMASRGLVLYEGRYVTAQHIELMEREKAAKVSQADWSQKIEQLRRWLVGRREDRAAQAHTELLAITDPGAAPAIVNLLRREKDPELKRLWIEVASHLNHAAAVDALVDISLYDDEDDVRQLALEHLLKSGRQGVATPYVRALKDKDNEIVHRAAVALGQIRDHDTIGPLIDALITTHKVKVSDTNPDQQSYTLSGDGTFSFGGKGPQVVSQAFRNRAVLDALATMSAGANFDYDQEQWRAWLAAQAKAAAVDIRRDQ